MGVQIVHRMRNCSKKLLIILMSVCSAIHEIFCYLYFGSQPKSASVRARSLKKEGLRGKKDPLEDSP